MTKLSEKQFLKLKLKIKWDTLQIQNVTGVNTKSAVTWKRNLAGEN